jgi:hypothetical protein
MILVRQVWVSGVNLSDEITSVPGITTPPSQECRPET